MSVGGGMSRIRIKIIQAKREAIGVGTSVKFLRAEVEVSVVVVIGKNLRIISNNRKINNETDRLPIIQPSSSQFRALGTTLVNHLDLQVSSHPLGLEKVGFYTPWSWVIAARDRNG
jgi:hypothetical protein